MAASIAIDALSAADTPWAELVDQKKAKKAKEIDVAWLKDYKVK